MSIGEILMDIIRGKSEDEITSKIMAHHWPAVQQSLIEEFPDMPKPVRDDVGKAAIARLISHII